MILEGDRLRLRPAGEDDLGRLFTWWSDPRQIGEHLSIDVPDWFGFQKFVDEASAAPFKQVFFIASIKNGDSGVGFVTYFSPYLFSPAIEIGYQIDLEHRKKGYASEAVGLMVDYLFVAKDVQRIQAMTDVENVASQKVLEKNGFRKEGQLRKVYFTRGKFADDYMYSILREEWLQRVPTRGSERFGRA